MMMSFFSISKSSPISVINTAFYINAPREIIVLYQIVIPISIVFFFPPVFYTFCRISSSSVTVILIFARGQPLFNFVLNLFSQIICVERKTISLGITIISARTRTTKSSITIFVQVRHTLIRVKICRSIAFSSLVSQSNFFSTVGVLSIRILSTVDVFAKKRLIGITNFRINYRAFIQRKVFNALVLGEFS